MKLKDYLNEADKLDEVGLVVDKAWKKIFPKSLIIHHQSSFGSTDYKLFTCTLGKTRSEYANGIRQNDPLSLSFSIDISPKEYVVTWQGSSLSIVPENKMYAYSSRKLGLRKFRAKDLKLLAKKLDTAFKKTKDVVKKALKDGELDVHGEDIVAMIKKKV